MTPIILKFSGITPEVMSALSAKAKSAGLDLSGDTGSADYDGCRFTWTRFAERNTLDVACVGKPWYVPESVIRDHLSQLVTAAGGKPVNV